MPNSISNTGGTLSNVVYIEWEEEQDSDVAIRKIPTRSAGALVDTGTFTLKNRVLRITIRLTDAEKTTLQAIFDAHAECTITAYPSATYYWTYTAWFEKKPEIYEYVNPNTREWRAKLVFVCSSYEYTMVCPCDRADGFETGSEADFWLMEVADPYDIVTTAAYVYNGTYGAKSDDKDGIWKHSLSGSNTTKWITFRFKIVPNPDSPPSGGSSAPLITIRLTDGEENYWDTYLYVVTGGSPSPRFRLQDEDSNWQDGITALSDNTWYCIKFKIEISATQVVTTVYINDVQDVTMTAIKAGYGTFYYLFLYCIQWTFGMDCRSALDNWCEVDGTTEPSCTLPDSCWS